MALFMLILCHYGIQPVVFLKLEYQLKTESLKMYNHKN